MDPFAGWVMAADLQKQERLQGAVLAVQLVTYFLSKFAGWSACLSHEM